MDRADAMSALLVITDAQEIEEMIFDFQNGATFMDAEVRDLIAIVATAQEPIMNSQSTSLHQGDEISLTTGHVVRSSQSQTAKQVWPWYPLAGHREGLRANDLVTLHSAFVILAFHGGTAHMSETPGTVRLDGSVVPFQNNPGGLSAR